MDKIIDRVKKLLALSKGNANVHEAAAAFAQAQKLIAKHNLDEAEISKSSSGFTEVIFFSGKRISNWKAKLGAAIAYSNNCFPWNDRRGGYAFRVAGSESELEICQFMFDAAVNQIEKMAKDYMAQQNMGRAGAKRVSNSFKTGAVTAFNEKLREMNKEVEKEYQGTQALVVTKNKLKKVENWVNNKIDLVPTKRPTVSLNAKAFAEGQQAGRKIQINKAIK